jgi:hypothetical protein
VGQFVYLDSKEFHNFFFTSYLRIPRGTTEQDSARQSTTAHDSARQRTTAHDTTRGGTYTFSVWNDNPQIPAVVIKTAQMAWLRNWVIFSHGDAIRTEVEIEYVGGPHASRIPGPPERA